MTKSELWAYLIALVLAFIGTLYAIGGAWLVFADQAQLPGSAMWPFPGLVLLDWAILGILGFLGALFWNSPEAATWLKAIWFVVGALMPLIVLGAFSIGTFVLITWCFMLASAVINTFRSKGKWLAYLGTLMIGAIGNLGLLLLFNVIGNSPV
jgi:hypothetical protein